MKSGQAFLPKKFSNNSERRKQALDRSVETLGV